MFHIPIEMSRNICNSINGIIVPVHNFDSERNEVRKVDYFVFYSFFYSIYFCSSSQHSLCTQREGFRFDYYLWPTSQHSRVYTYDCSSFLLLCIPYVQNAESRIFIFMVIAKIQERKHTEQLRNAFSLASSAAGLMERRKRSFNEEVMFRTQIIVERNVPLEFIVIVILLTHSSQQLRENKENSAQM